MSNLLVNAVVHTGQFTSVNLPSGMIWSTIIISLIITLAFYILRSIGLFVLAKNQKINKAFLAFIPGVWIYLACKIIGKARIFGKTFEQLAIWLGIIFTAFEVLTLAYNIIAYIPLVEYVFVLGKTVHIAESGATSTVLKEYLGMGIYLDSAFVPYGDSWFAIGYVLGALGLFIDIFDILSIFITVSVYFALFRKFWPQHYMLASLLSVFLGLFPVFVFVIRNKKPIDYNEYLRSRYGTHANPYGYGGAYGPYNNPYSNPYQQPRRPESPFGEYEDGSSSSNGANSRPSEPFGEFSGEKEKKQEDPFSDFDKKNNGKSFDD